MRLHLPLTGFSPRRWREGLAGLVGSGLCGNSVPSRSRLARTLAPPFFARDLGGMHTVGLAILLRSGEGVLTRLHPRRFAFARRQFSSVYERCAKWLQLGSSGRRCFQMPTDALVLKMELAQGEGDDEGGQAEDDGDIDHWGEEADAEERQIENR